MNKTESNIRILTDALEENPSLDFDNYARTISKLIRNSEPRFTIGIYGEWGTGKSTLMNKIMNQLQTQESDQQKIIPIWFNAWRYEREEKYATIALMKTIAYALTENKKFVNVRKTILRGLKFVGMDMIRKITTDTVMTEKGWNELESKLTEKMEILDKIEKDTIYFDGIELIKKELKKIRNEDNEYRIVVFIDDLDRCSPKKALEILESIKVFLDIEGFVYVMGLSFKTVDRLISQAYQDTGVKGSDYIKKIIQIPIRIPPWSISDIKELTTKIADEMKPYDQLIKNNAELIATGIEINPRELKRFTNNLIVAFEILNKKDIGEKEFLEILILEILKNRWNEFYVLLVTEEDFRTSFLNYLSLKRDERDLLSEIKLGEEKSELNEKKKQHLANLINKIKGDFPLKIEYFVKVMNDFPKNLTQFVFDRDDIRTILLGIEDWEYYRRITGITEEIKEEHEGEYIKSELLYDHLIRIPSGTGSPGCEEKGRCFIPSYLKIKENEVVNWINDDSAAHTVTSGTPEDGPEGTFDSGLFMSGSNFATKFRKKGIVPYFCMVHPWQQGEIEIT